MKISYSELKKKEVVNVITGSNLGKIIDLIIEEKSGKIISIIVPGRKSGFLCCENEELDFDCITTIGADTILYKPCTRKEEKDCECKDEKPFCIEDE